MRRIVEAAAAAVLLAPRLANAQGFLDLRIQPSFESWDGSGGAQGAVSGSAAAEYEFDGRGRLFYGLEGGTFATVGDWSYLEHDAGFTWRLGDDRRRVFLGVRGTLRRNGRDWSAADYGGAEAMANTEWAVSPLAKVRFGYRLARRDFTGLPVLDHIEHGTFGNVLLNLPSRTTLLGEAHLGAKSYGGGAARAGQVTWLARLAQSLADRTGLSVQASGRFTSGEVPPILVTTPPAFLDDGVYDDPFASDAFAIRAAIKQAFEGGAVLEAEGSWQRKDYVALLALDATGMPLAPAALRLDRSWRAQARVSLPVWPARTGPLAVALDVSYSFLDRSSNDVFYDHRSHGVLAAVSLRY